MSLTIPTEGAALHTNRLTIRASYMEHVFDDAETIIEQATDVLDPWLGKFDTLVSTGLSGALIPYDPDFRTDYTGTAYVVIPGVPLNPRLPTAAEDRRS